MHAGSGLLEDIGQAAQLKAFGITYFGGLDAAQTACQLGQNLPWALAPDGEFGLDDALCAACSVSPAIIAFQVGIGRAPWLAALPVAHAHCTERRVTTCSVHRLKRIDRSSTVYHAMLAQDLNDVHDTDDVPRVYCARCAARLQPKVRPRLLMAPKTFAMLRRVLHDNSFPVAVSMQACLAY